MYLDLKCAFCGVEGGCACMVDQDDGTVIDMDVVYVTVPVTVNIAQLGSAKANLNLCPSVRVVNTDPLVVRPDLKS